MKVFQVVHVYTIRAFGDCIEKEETITSFESFNDANDFAEKFKNPHECDAGFCHECGTLQIRELSVISHKGFDINAFKPQDFWWSHESEVHKKILHFACALHTAYGLSTDIYGRTTDEYATVGYEDYPRGTSVESIIGDIRYFVESAGLSFTDVMEAEEKIAS